MENKDEVKRLEALPDDELLETYLGHLAFREMSDLIKYDGSNADESELERVCKSCSAIWEKMSFGLGSEISWHPDDGIESLSGKISKICEDRGAVFPQGTEVGEVLGIWNGKLHEMGIFLDLRLDSPVYSQPVEQRIDSVVSVGKLLHIDDAVCEFYANR